MKKIVVSVALALVAVVLIAAVGDSAFFVKCTTAAGGTCAQDLNFTGTVQFGGVAPTNANTNSAIVKRDSSGNFSAGTISAALTGTASGNLANARIATGAGAPSTTPTAAGYLYIDTSNHKLYFSDASVDSGSWIIAN